MLGVQTYRRFNLKHAKQYIDLVDSYYCSHVIRFDSVGECWGRYFVWDRTRREHWDIWCWASYEVNYTGRNLQCHTHAGAPDSQRISTIVIVLTAWQIKAPPPIWTESISEAAFLKQITDMCFSTVTYDTHEIPHLKAGEEWWRRSVVRGICKIIFCNGFSWFDYFNEVDLVILS